MAGDVFLSDSAQWSANNSLFDWVLDFLIESATSAGVVAELEEIRDDNIRMIDVESFGEAGEQELRELIRSRLMSHARAQLPSMLADREGFLAELQKLVDIAHT